MMDKNEIRYIDTMDQLNALSIRKIDLDKMNASGMSYEEMARISGKSVYEVRRHLGLVQ